MLYQSDRFNAVEYQALDVEALELTQALDVRIFDDDARMCDSLAHFALALDTLD